MNHSHPISTNQSMVMKLVAKDWYFNKQVLYLLSLLGLISVYLLSFKSSIFYVGLVLLLSIVISIGALLVFSTVVNERKNQTLAFMMSLPITCMDYTKAKMILNLSAYFVAWSLLVAATIGVIIYTQHLPNGLIPYALIILIELLVAFILVLATALVSDSEKWSILVMSITNISVSLFMLFVSSIEDIKIHMEGPVAVWNFPTILIISIELIIILFTIGLTFYLQSRKKDFT